MPTCKPRGGRGRTSPARRHRPPAEHTALLFSRRPTAPGAAQAPRRASGAATGAAPASLCFPESLCGWGAPGRARRQQTHTALGGTGDRRLRAGGADVCPVQAGGPGAAWQHVLAHRALPPAPRPPLAPGCRDTGTHGHRDAGTQGRRSLAQAAPAAQEGWKTHQLVTLTPQ